ncbi:MAG: hypothetical protein KatS3mg129_1059 [Leptospiraceae bacterium]|nr:MAG: hypothetical protein KatS3mg129_1059 [Leptospiraceae bacterium]
MEETQNISQEEVSVLKQKYEDLKQKYEALKGKAGEEWIHIKEKMQVYGEGAEEFFDSLSRYIKENPQRASIIAGALGLSIGFILGILIRGGKR